MISKIQSFVNLDRTRCGAACILASTLLLSACSKDDAYSELNLAQRVDQGVEYLRVFNFESAYNLLSDVQPNLKRQNTQWPLATYSLALAAWHKAPPQPEAMLEAESLFNAVIEHDEDSVLAASALLDLGRMAEISDFRGDITDVASAQKYYRQVIEEFSGTEMATRGSMYLAQSMAQSLEPEQVKAAIAVLDTALAEQPDSPWASTMLQYQAQLYAFYLHDYSSALVPYEKAMALGFPRSSEGDLSLWQLGLIAEQAHGEELAAKAYTTLIRKYSRSVYGSAAQNRLKAIAAAHPNLNIQVPELRQIELGR